jgi:hypothetical protein
MGGLIACDIPAILLNRVFISLESLWLWIIRFAKTSKTSNGAVHRCPIDMVIEFQNDEKNAE